MANTAKNSQPGIIQSLYDSHKSNIYSKISPYTPNSGLLSFGPEQPFIHIKIDDGRSGINGLKRFENRSFPIGSGPQDVERVSKFLATGNGILFLSKQFLLQRFNSFNETRIYNPLSPIASSVRATTLFSTDYPIRHVEGGLLGALTGLIGLNISKSDRVAGTIGELPAEGYNNFKGLIRPQTANSAMNRFHAIHGGGSGGSGLLDKAMSKIGGPVGVAYNLFNSFKSQQQEGVQKADEQAYDIMLNDPLLAKNDIIPRSNVGGFTKLFDSIFTPPTTYTDANKIKQRWYNSKNTNGLPNIDRRLYILKPGNSFAEPVNNHEDTLGSYSIGYDINDASRYSDIFSRSNGDIYNKSDIVLIYKNLYSGDIPVDVGDDNNTDRKNIADTYSNKTQEPTSTKIDEKYTSYITSSEYKKIPGDPDDRLNNKNAVNVDNTYSNIHDDSPGIKLNASEEYKKSYPSEKVEDLYDVKKQEKGYDVIPGDKNDTNKSALNIDGTYSNIGESTIKSLHGEGESEYGLTGPFGKEFVRVSGSNLDWKGTNISVLSDFNKNEIAEKLEKMLPPGLDQYYKLDRTSDVDLTYYDLLSHKSKDTKPNGYERRVTDKISSLESNSPTGKGFSGTGKHDAVNILDVLDSTFNEDAFDPYVNDQIAFYFHDLVNDKYIPFRSTVKGINEQLSANWSDVSYVGRADKMYNYTGFTRNLSFNFSVVAMSIRELLPMWKRINYLSSLVKPSKYIESISVGEFPVPPLVTITIGDLYKEQPIILQTIGITIPDDALWETLPEQWSDNNDWSYLNDKIEWKDSKGKYAQFPRECEISIGGPLIEQERPQVGMNNFGGVGSNSKKFSESLVVGQSPSIRQISLSERSNTNRFLPNKSPTLTQ